MQEDEKTILRFDPSDLISKNSDHIHTDRIMPLHKKNEE